MGRIDDVLAPARGAGVPGDLLDAGVEDDLGVARLQGEEAPGAFRGNAVGVPLEADAAEGAGAHREDDPRVVGARGEGTQERPFLREEVHGAAAGGGVEANVGDLQEPAGDLAVERFEVRHLAAGEEVAAQVQDAVLDPALLLGAVGVAGDGLEAVVLGKVEEARMEADTPGRRGRGRRFAGCRRARVGRRRPRRRTHARGRPGRPRDSSLVVNST